MYDKNPLYLLGVRHTEDEIAEVAEALLRKAKKGQTVGLEIDSEVLEEFSRIRDLQSKGKSLFKDAFEVFYLNRLRKSAVDAKIGSWRVKEFVNTHRTQLQDPLLKLHALTSFEFFYGIYNIAIENKLKIKSLVRVEDVYKALVLNVKCNFEMNTKKYNLLNEERMLSEAPLREHGITENITSDVDFAITGIAHTEELKNRLKKKRRIESQYTYKYMPRGITKTHRELRSRYWQKIRTISKKIRPK